MSDEVSVTGRKPLYALLLASALGLTLAACGKSNDEKPTGQVVARLNGEDITQREVTAELQGTATPANMTRREAEKVALANIITRRTLANAAVERELTKSPQFLLDERRMAEQLKVQALARDIASGINAPTRDEALNFISANPQMFAERKIYLVDQIQFPRPENFEKLGMEDTRSMEEVEKLLRDNNIEFRRQDSRLDALAANQDFITELEKLLARNPQELFMFANQQPGTPVVMQVNQVKETRVVPFIPPKAIDFAIRYEHNQRIRKALADEVEKQQAAARESVAYQEGWEPTPPAEGAEGKPAGANAALPVPEEHAVTPANSATPPAPVAPAASTAPATVAN